MKQEDWIKDLQKRMADHQESVKDSLWADIEQALDERKVVKKPTTPIVWRRYAAAAAIVIALMGGAGYILLGPKQQISREVELANKQTDAIAQPVSEHKQSVDNLPHRNDDTRVSSVQKIISTVMKAATQTEQQLAVVQPKDMVGISNADSLSVQDVEIQPSDDEKKLTEDATVGHHAPTKSEQKSAVSLPTQTLEPAKRHREPPKKLQAKVSMNLYAANSVGSYSGSNGLMMSELMAKSFSVASDNEPMFCANYTSPVLSQSHEETKHQQPISFGVSVGYALNRKFMLTTGVVYTKLSSDFIQVLPDDRLVRHQALYYIGVPLNMSYKIWATERLKTYLTVGEQMDVNVRAKTEKEGVEHNVPKDKLQFSTQAALGVQYNIMPHLGAYIEPGVKYYHNNQSGIENFFKDKPLNFNLQIGVRWEINRSATSSKGR